jgi:hypothetical protein
MPLIEKSAPCVISRLAGGLGNQLFMYAFAKALAVRNDVPLLLDARSGFVRDRNYRRNFLLDYLIPEERHASRWQSHAWPLIGRALQSLDRKRNAQRPLDERDYLRERSADFDAEIYHLRLKRPVIIEGYWQSPRYFDDLPLRETLNFPDVLTRTVQPESEAIRSSNAVCLAVRRYEEIPKLKRPMHILDADYYRRAMSTLEEKIDNPHYFVFAQDMQWARKNIQSQHPITFATEKDPNAGAIQDLYLMTLCRHFIISNSTLHWWAAWLAADAGGKVIAPRAGWSSKDTLHDTWLAI